MPMLSLLALLAGLLATSKASSVPLVDIVGGRKAKLQELHDLGLNSGRPSLVSSTTLPTTPRNPGTAMVLGAYDLRRRENSRQRFSIRSISENGYDPQEYLNDLLLLQLDGEANLTSSVTLVPPPQQNDMVEASTNCKVAGWGTQQHREPLSHFPKVLNVTVTPSYQCCPNNVCTGILTCRGAICQGDGGTPLVCNGLAHGMASFSMAPCGCSNFFTCVALFQNWIGFILNPSPTKPVGACEPHLRPPPHPRLVWL
ncbi:LOW QUALITY PROTEIN: azurocidin [Hipposideros larvatus]